MSIPDPPARFRWLPWHSATAGWVAAGLILALGVPLFLCMPPWNDVTLHDMAARYILRGGVHYRDVFDTNLPGIDWAMAGIRRVFGTSCEVLRAADLLVIAAITGILALWLRRAGGAGYTAAWFVAAVALFYPFSSEFNHVQRDPWLLLPAAAAAYMRLTRTVRLLPQADALMFPPSAPSLGRSFVEGIVWGLAVWVKPHVMVPAVAIWLASALAMSRRESLRSIGLDLAALMAGGLAAGAAGVAWLLATGAWPYFLDVFLNWNPGYMTDVWPQTWPRFLRTFYCFRPWSILHAPALLLALLALWEVRLGSRRPREPRRVPGPRWLYFPAESERVAIARALLAAFYLGWFAQAAFLQKGLDYVQVPLLLLGMTMAATQRWAFGFVFLLWFAMVGLLACVPSLKPVADELEPVLRPARSYRDPFSDPAALRLWRRCWREGSTPELRDRLGQLVDIHCGTKWEDLAAVARYLRSIDPPLGPGELNCWHDSTHPLYLMLDLEPATRYMHYGTAFGIRPQAERIAAEVRASRQRYVVSDLLRMTWEFDDAYAPGAGNDSHRLPLWFPLSQRDKFPWNQPIVFRAGRYLVHKVERPLGEIDVPDWSRLDELGPGER